MEKTRDKGGFILTPWPSGRPKANPVQPDMNHYLTIGPKPGGVGYQVMLHCRVLECHKRHLKYFDTKEDAIIYVTSEATRLHIDPNWIDNI